MSRPTPTPPPPPGPSSPPPPPGPKAGLRLDVSDHIRRCVAAAPPLTEAQYAELAPILGGLSAAAPRKRAA